MFFEKRLSGEGVFLFCGREERCAFEKHLDKKGVFRFGGLEEWRASCGRRDGRCFL